MILYHGSYHNFDFPNMSQIKKYSKESSLLNEGHGLYCTTMPGVAKSYGKYVYEINVDTKDVKVFNSYSGVHYYIVDIILFIKERNKVDISPYININSIAAYVVSGKIGLCNIGGEIEKILDNSEPFYNRYGSVSEVVYNSLRLWDKKHLPGCYKVECSVPNTFIIKDFTLIKGIRKVKVIG